MDSNYFKSKLIFKKPVFWLILFCAVIVGVYLKIQIWSRGSTPRPSRVESLKMPEKPEMTLLNTVAYDKKLNEIANIFPSAGESTSTPPTGGWPVKAAYPNAGALLPFNRVVAYYGNLYSKGMGILGEYSPEVVLEKLRGEVKKWQVADPSTQVLPALHYIAVVAQAGPTRDGKYRARMPDKEIDKVLAMAKEVDGIVFLDIQVGFSSVEVEVPLLEKYLKLPNVHLGIDPEFAMHNGDKPGTAIGSLDAKDINFAAEYLSQIVKANSLTPKILVIHRFTQPMVKNYKQITPLPEVQIVMDMDGFGGQANKINTYKQFIYKEPVQFTGFKLFYKNDSKRGPLLSPEQLLKLTPIPVYIQYQ